MTIEALADSEGISRQAVWKIIGKLEMRDELILGGSGGICQTNRLTRSEGTAGGNSLQHPARRTKAGRPSPTCGRTGTTRIRSYQTCLNSSMGRTKRYRRCAKPLILHPPYSITRSRSLTTFWPHSTLRKAEAENSANHAANHANCGQKADFSFTGHLGHGGDRHEQIQRRTIALRGMVR